MLQLESTAAKRFDGIVGDSRALRGVLREVGQVAPVETTVLLTGETGTGKELIARAIHESSGRRNRPLVKINCGAIPQGVVESELFGHEKGAFTGALQRRIGRFEMANGGTLFMDEVGELPLDVQVKLLRVLQEQEFERVGSTVSQKVDVRIIAATNRDLEAEVAAGRFRADLYYRLNVFPIRVPSLRERRSDIPLLVKHFLAQFQRKLAKPLAGVTEESMALLESYAWPGNIRELQNVMERTCVLAPGSMVEISAEDVGGVAAVDLASERAPAPQQHARFASANAVPGRIVGSVSSDRGNQLMTLDENERAHIRRAMRVAGGRIHGPRGAASMLGINPSTLRSRMLKLGIEKGGVALAS